MNKNLIKIYVATMLSGMLLLSSTVQSQQCNNLDFESGSLSGWVGTYGHHPKSGIGGGCCPSTGIVAGKQDIISGNGIDTCAGIPVIPAGGGLYAAKLGNALGGAEAERLEKDFLVTSATAFVTYRYAVIAKTAGHADSMECFFKVELFNTSTGAKIKTDSLVAGVGANWLTSVKCSGVKYIPWTSECIDLSGYVGINVTIRFTNSDCASGGHSCYSYVDVSCGAWNISQDNTLCTGDTITLYAPAGQSAYQWSPGGAADTTNALNIFATGSYSVSFTSASPCPTNLTITVNQHPKPVASFTYTAGTSINFTSTSTLSSGTIASYAWDFGDGNSSTQQSPSHTYLTNGTYTVCLTAVSDSGCTDTSCQTINVTTAGINNVIFTEKNVHFFPNPLNSNLLTIDIGAFYNDSKEARIFICNALGQTIFEQQIGTAEKLHILNLANIASGIYSIGIITDKNYGAGELIIQ